jgi:subtilisin family serine protease
VITAKTIRLLLTCCLLILASLFLSCGSEEGNVNSAPLYREGELLVKFKPDVNMTKAQFTHKAVGSRSKRRFESSGVEHIVLPSGLTVKNAVQLYMANPDVEYAEPNYIVRKAVIPNDEYFNLQWGLNNIGQEINGVVGTYDADIDAPEVWDLHTGNGSIVVAVMDTGVDYNHEDIAANIWVNTGEVSDNGLDDDGNGYVDDIRGWNFAYAYGNNNPMDDDVDSHGTHVAGIIGAVGNNSTGISGVNWTLKIMSLKVLDSSGSGDIADVLQGIDYAVVMGAKIINASYTYPQSCTTITPSLAEKDAIKAAGDAGILLIAAAGNYGCDNDVYPFYPASHALPNIISVAASDSNDNLSSFSNYGINSVHVVAPGDEIYSAIRTDLESYGYLSGTSMASPFVAGLAALVASYHPDYTHIAIREAILSSVEQKPSFTNKLLSDGRLNAYNALTLNIETIPPFKPTHLRATTISNTQIDLTWVDNSSVETNYIIERKTGIDGIYVEIETLSQNATTYSDTTVTEGTTYYYSVRAYNVNGYSLYLNEASATTQTGASNGSGGGSGGGDGECFIATAAYGSYMANEVRVLREFRDKWLLASYELRVAGYELEIPNIFGKVFVSIYYKYSPPIADYIAGHESLRTITRIALTPVVYSVKYPYLLVGMLVICAGGLVIARRQRKR